MQQSKLCFKCDLVEGNTHNAVDYGNPNAKLLIIRNTPPAGETRNGEFLSSTQNKYLINYLASFGFTHEDYYITTVIRCSPNRPVGNADIVMCGDTMKDTVNRMKPKIIMGFGKLPTHVFLNDYVAVPTYTILGKVFKIGNMSYIQNHAISAIIADDVAKRSGNKTMNKLLDEYRIKIDINK